MPTEYRALGTVIKITSTITLTTTLTLSDTVGTITLNSSDAAYATIATGTYRLSDFAFAVLDGLQTWFSAAVTADAGITTKGTASVTLTFSPATTANGSLFSLAFSLVGASNANGAITFASGTIDNATAGYSPLGLVLETATGSTTRAGTVSPSTTITWAGLWQPRSIFVFERSEADFGNTEEAANAKTLVYADGTASFYQSGRQITRRTLRLQDLAESVTGRSRPFGRTASSTPLATDKVTLNLQTTSLATNATLSGISSLYYQSANATNGRYVRVPGASWVSRLSSSSASSAVLVEKVPASSTVHSGAAVEQISEAHALWFEALRLGYLVVYDTDPSSGILWVSEEYAVDGGTQPTWAPERHSPGAPLYSYSFNLVRRDSPGLTLVS